MMSILFFIFIIWLMFGFIKFAAKVTWGLLKVVGIVLSIIAFPALFLIVITIGFSGMIILPLIVIGVAFGCLASV